MVDLKKAPGLDKVEGNCGACHSLDYIQMNSPYPNAALWDAEVTKMIKAYGAPITDADATGNRGQLEEELRELSGLPPDRVGCSLAAFRRQVASCPPGGC